MLIMIVLLFRVLPSGNLTKLLKMTIKNSELSKKKW